MYPIKSITPYLFFFICIWHGGYAQQDFKGLIVDDITNEPIPYVNIGILQKGIGTVSDEQGLFHLELDPPLIKPSDTLQISSIGYKTIKKLVSDLQFSYNEYPRISMIPQVEILKEVIVTNTGLFESEDQIGYKQGGQQSYGYWKDNVALGGELATKIRVKKGLRKLNEFTFTVLGNTSDSVLIRVNFYDEDGKWDFPGTNLNTSGRNILHTIKSTPGLSRVDLREFDLFVRDDFIVSLELLKVYGKSKIGLILAASNNRYTDSFKKYASQDNWEIMADAAMAYQLESTLFTKKQKKLTKRREKKKTESKISGYVFHGNIALSKVEVINLSKDIAVYTNEKGNYEIEADKGDMLQFVVHGMKKLTVKILEKKFINVRLDRS